MCHKISPHVKKKIDCCAMLLGLTAGGLLLYEAMRQNGPHTKLHQQHRDDTSFYFWYSHVSSVLLGSFLQVHIIQVVSWYTSSPKAHFSAD